MKGSSLVITATLAIAACAADRAGESGGIAKGEAPIRELERRAVGPAEPYPADTLTAADEDLYARSKMARRELGWRVLSKALAPVKIAAKIAAPLPSKPDATIPRFRTWMGGDEVERVFAKMYGDLGRDRRKAKDVPTESELASLFDWNAKGLGPSSEADYFARLKQVDDGDGTHLNGLGGNARTAYSPGYVKQYLTDYPAMAGCDLDALSFETPPRADTNFTNCFSREMPADAAVIKTSWRRNDAIVPDGLPVVDTSATALATADTWKPSAAPKAKAGPTEAYSVTMSDDAGYSLVGLHIMTKELRHWVWVTVWWSPDANGDFGQDRPAEIAALGAPWDHYEMCVVTDFEEKDPDPRGGFEGSLGDALAAVHGKNTWCSNPFLEKGTHNAQTNCIGCHQHAGDAKVLDAVLGFPEAGRAKSRESFPADYSWAFTTPPSPDPKDRLLDVVTRRMKVYANE